jgi:MscS family membrane protein
MIAMRLLACTLILTSCLWPTLAAEPVYPLEPPDLSSPRATLRTFLTTSDELQAVLRDEYWHQPTRDIVARVAQYSAELERTLDLSGIPPGARFELGRDGIYYLFEVLSRIELPPVADIPDAAAQTSAPADGSESHALSSWKIPHTDITLVRMAEGPRAGEYLFSTSTVERAREFYEKVRMLPYRRDVALENYVEMRPYLSMRGWVIPARTLERFPDWLKHSVFGQAVWKWMALLTLVGITGAVIFFIHRLARQRSSGHPVGIYLRRLLSPLAVLLMPLALTGANEQLTLTGWVSGGVELAAETITYLALAWIIWIVSMIIAEAVIASPRIPSRSLNAHLLRLVARTVGIASVVGIILYLSNQLGVPLYGLIAGLGIGGLAIALAVRPTLENIVGGITLFTDKPVRVGDFCRFGQEEGEVEAIGLRSTRIRKRDDTLVSVPNADFSQRELHNFARRRRRLYQTTIGLRYETSPEQLRYVMARLREMLLGHPKVSPDSLFVRFDGFGAYSLDVAIFAYIRTRERLTYRAVREDINLRVMDIVAEAGTGFAFPSQTAYLGRDAGIDTGRGREAEAQVQEWRSSGQLPFPEFDERRRKEKEDILDYPPIGSPDYKPPAGSS